MSCCDQCWSSHMSKENSLDNLSSTDLSKRQTPHFQEFLAFYSPSKYKQMILLACVQHEQVQARCSHKAVRETFLLRRRCASAGFVSLYSKQVKSQELENCANQTSTHICQSVHLQSDQGVAQNSGISFVFSFS